jgi:FAD/FMN-containing dehydrogenase
LVKIFPSKTLVSSESAFANWTESFWSQQQEEVIPQSIFKPANAIDVSSAVLLAELFSCPFAVKSGGHAAFSGASNIQGGLSIDLGALDSITLSKDQTVASAGAGNVWVDVYNYLEPYGLSVIGGRVSTIGLGGLTTGGMFQSNQ